jgi:hypothetical protein
VNTRQRESICKCLYDISKGFLLAGVIGYLAGKLVLLALIAHFVAAINAFFAAYFMEGDK